MSFVTHGVCPVCNKIVSTQTISQDLSAPIKVSYVKGQECESGCTGRGSKDPPSGPRNSRRSGAWSGGFPYTFGDFSLD